MFGVEGHDAEVPDPSRAAAADQQAALARVEAELATVDRDALDGPDRISHTILTRLLRDEQRTLRDGLAEVAVTASIAGPLAQVGVGGAGGDRLRRGLPRPAGKLGGFFDGHVERYRQAAADGRFPTELGVRQAIAQVDAYLGTPAERDPLLRRLPGMPAPPSDRDIAASGVDPVPDRSPTAAPAGSPRQRKVGLCHVPGGADGYRALVRAYTTTDLTPERSTRSGWTSSPLREEFAERGGRALGTTDVAEVLRRLAGRPRHCGSVPAGRSSPR